MIIGLTSRGGDAFVFSSECAGIISFQISRRHKDKPKKYQYIKFPIERIPKFASPEEAEAWLDAQSI